jgi:hypothetical protein
MKRHQEIFDVRGQLNAQTNASPNAEDIADINKNTDITRERMFFGAFVNAYSSPVMDAKISLTAIRTYLKVRP